MFAGIDWLLSKFKAYVMLRDRLLTDTSILRDKLDVAVPEFANGETSYAKMGAACMLQPAVISCGLLHCVV